MTPGSKCLESVLQLRTFLQWWETESVLQLRTFWVTTGSKGPESALQLRTLLGDAGKQMPRIRTAAEDFLAMVGNGVRAAAEDFLGDDGKQRPRVRATAEDSLG